MWNYIRISASIPHHLHPIFLDYTPLPQGFNMLNQKSCCYLSIIPNLALHTLCIMSDHQYNFYWSGIMGSWWEEKIQWSGQPGIWSLHFDYYRGLLDVCNHILRMYWSSEGKQTLTTNCKLPVNYVTILLLRSPQKFKGCFNTKISSCQS